jgi:hypothetical protein
VETIGSIIAEFNGQDAKYAVDKKVFEKESMTGRPTNILAL